MLGWANIEELNAIGGMRRPHDSVRKVKGHQVLGPVIFEATNTFLDDNPDVQAGILSSLENGNDEHQVPDGLELEAYVNILAKLVDAEDTSPSCSKEHDTNTSVRGGRSCRHDLNPFADQWVRAVCRPPPFLPVLSARPPSTGR